MNTSLVFLVSAAITVAINLVTVGGFFVKIGTKLGGVDEKLLAIKDDIAVLLLSRDETIKLGARVDAIEDRLDRGGI